MSAAYASMQHLADGLEAASDELEAFVNRIVGPKVLTYERALESTVAPNGNLIVEASWVVTDEAGTVYYRSPLRSDVIEWGRTFARKTGATFSEED